MLSFGSVDSRMLALRFPADPEQKVLFYIRRWLRACRAVVLKLRSKQRMFSGLARSFGTLQTGVKATSFLGSCVLGPQLSLAFSMEGLSDQHHTHHPEPAHLQVEVSSHALFEPGISSEPDLQMSQVARGWLWLHSRCGKVPIGC